MIGVTGRCGGGGSILTTAHGGSFLENLLALAALEQLQWSGTGKDRMRPLQPADLGKVAHLHDRQNVRQALNDTIGAIRVELPQGKAPLPLIAHAQQRAAAQSIENGLTVADPQEGDHLTAADAAAKQLAAHGEAGLQRLEFQYGRACWFLRQPAVQLQSLDRITRRGLRHDSGLCCRSGSSMDRSQQSLLGLWGEPGAIELLQQDTSKSTCPGSSFSRGAVSTGCHGPRGGIKPV